MSAQCPHPRTEKSASASGPTRSARNPRRTTLLAHTIGGRARRAANETWLSVAEGAEYAGVSRDTIYTAR